MVHYLLTSCTDCDSLRDAICELEEKLYQYGKYQYQNISYLTNKPHPLTRIRELIYYKSILENLKWNQSYYYPFYNFQTIVSRVKAITNGL